MINTNAATFAQLHLFYTKIGMLVERVPTEALISRAVWRCRTLNQNKWTSLDAKKSRLASETYITRQMGTRHVSKSPFPSKRFPECLIMAYASLPHD